MSLSSFLFGPLLSKLDTLLRNQASNQIQIMSAISDYAAKQQAVFDKMTADLKAITDLINKLQTTPGPISAEDQATLDDLQAKATAFEQALNAAATTPVPTT